MRLNRPQGAATDREPTAGVARRRLSGRAIRLLSVTAVAAATCSLWAGAASAATASTTKHATKTSVSVSPKTEYVRTDAKLSATVTGSGARPTGTVTFWSGARKLCDGKLAKGKMHCYADFLTAGSKTVVGRYSGNATHKASSGSAKETVITRPAATKYATTTTITNANPGTVNVGSKFTFDVSVASTGAGAPAATGTVQVTATTEGTGPDFDCTATVTGGEGSCTITAPEYGVVDYDATYSGDSTHDASTYTGPYALAMMNVTTTTLVVTSGKAGDITLTADVNAGGANIDENEGGTGTVTFYVGTTADNLEPVTGCADQMLTAFDGTNNTATCTGNAELNALVSGTTYVVSAVYSGDEINDTSTSANVNLDPS
jgi:Bacterial Ig-like domain (group 3)